MYNIFRPELVVTTKKKSNREVVRAVQEKLCKYSIDRIVVDNRAILNDMSQNKFESGIEIVLEYDLERYVIKHGVTGRCLFVISNPDNFLWT